MLKKSRLYLRSGKTKPKWWFGLLRPIKMTHRGPIYSVQEVKYIQSIETYGNSPSDPIHHVHGDLFTFVLFIHTVAYGINNSTILSTSLDIGEECHQFDCGSTQASLKHEVQTHEVCSLKSSCIWGEVLRKLKICNEKTIRFELTAMWNKTRKQKRKREIT